MTKQTNHSPGHPAEGNPSPSQQLDAIIADTGDWRGETLSGLRTPIKKADPDKVVAVKWKKPSNPAGVPVGMHAGDVGCGDMPKNAVRLTFPHGPQMRDS